MLQSASIHRTRNDSTSTCPPNTRLPLSLEAVDFPVSVFGLSLGVYQRMTLCPASLAHGQGMDGVSASPADQCQGSNSSTKSAILSLFDLLLLFAVFGQKHAAQSFTLATCMQLCVNKQGASCASLKEKWKDWSFPLLCQRNSDSDQLCQPSWKTIPANCLLL